MGRTSLEFAAPSPCQGLIQSCPTSMHWNVVHFVVLGGIVLLILICVVVQQCRNFVKPLRLKEMSLITEQQQPAGMDFHFGFNFRTLKKSTNNFDRRKILGKSWGAVYLGKLDDGRLIAVKQAVLSGSCPQFEAEFISEIRILTSFQHKNLIRLLGFCSHGRHRLRVYEYMKNGSLDIMLYDRHRQFLPKSDHFLNWNTRFQIIIGIAEGLQHLHEDSHSRIVHRNIKTSNILLDEKFQPKIADFGVAMFFPEDIACLSTKFAGTDVGFAAPEYLIKGEVSEKADIYSFGVLLLEIISSRKARGNSSYQYLPNYAWELYSRSKEIRLVDPKLREDGIVEKDVIRLIHIALLCLQPLPKMRPAMSNVVAMLTCNVDLVLKPIRPFFMDEDIFSGNIKVDTEDWSSLFQDCTANIKG